MSALDDYQNAIVAKIQAAIPGINQVEAHYGQFNLPEIQRRVLDKTAAFVSMPTLKPGSVYGDGRITFLAEIAVVIVTAHDGPPPDGDAAVIGRRIMEQVLKLACWNAFAKAMPPTEIEGNELHWDKLDPQGMAMCVASWSQEILLSADDPFFSKEQARTADFSFPVLPESAPNTVKTNETATPSPIDLRGFYDKGVIR